MTTSAATGAGPAPAGAATPVGFAPEQFGARGDGVTDDAPAIQRALDAAAVAGAGHGLVILQPRVAYRCDHGLVMDCSRVSIWGQGLLDFMRHVGTCLHVDASSVAAPLTAANNYGHRGTIGGTLRIRGGGKGYTAIGLRFDTAATATAAQLLVENLAVSGCTVGIEFGRRAYNNLFVRCDLFDCAVAVRWPNADDNGERNTMVGCALFNSDTAVRMEQAAGALYLESCSIDYTAALYDVTRGLVFATDCHHESSRWAGRPIRAGSDGAGVHLSGGLLLGQVVPLPADYLVEAGPGAAVRIDGTFVHNLVPRAGPDGVTAWATGAGGVSMSSLQGFGEGLLPQRLHATRTALADPDFAAPDWQDPVWRLANGGAPVISRHGTGAEPLVLRRTAEGLCAIRRGASLSSRLALLCLPVRGGEQVLAGFRVRRRAGGGAISVSPCWARLDGYDAARVPVVTRLDSTGVLEMTLGNRWQPATPMATRANRVAPAWATHFVMAVDVTRVEGEILFRGLWGDVI